MNAVTARTFAVLLVLLLASSCGDSSADNGPATACESACDLIETACSATTPDCVDDCVDDVERCPTQMDALFDCLAANTLQCDPDEDQGLAQAPCQPEHASVMECGADPF